jgi:NAD(P)-dependent dehydrogenase (short-subunit alcohol dehydrogenase family)
MDLKLQGKRALITGSSAGIGAECARWLAREGCQVVVHGRNRKRADETAAEITAAGGQAAVTIGDLETDEGADTIAAEALAAFGGIDILVNNAGYAVRPDVPDWLDIPSSDFIKSFNINVVAHVRMAQRLAPGMIARGWGRIINFTSVAGYQSLGMMPDYGAAKAGVHNFTINLSQMIADKGVTVNTIAPGRVMTRGVQINQAARAGNPRWANSGEEAERMFKARMTPQPIDRMGEPAEIAAAVALLASPLSNYTTGALWRIDGGISKAL